VSHIARFDVDVRYPSLSLLARKITRCVSHIDRFEVGVRYPSLSLLARKITRRASHIARFDVRYPSLSLLARKNHNMRVTGSVAHIDRFDVDVRYPILSLGQKITRCVSCTV